MNKSNMRLLIALGMIVLLALSWYTLINDTKKANDEYTGLVTIAREKTEAGLYDVALEYYAEAQKLRDSISLRDEMAQIYQDHAEGSSYETFCEEIIKDFPLEIRGYERLAVYYRDTGAYDNCFDIIETVGKRGMQSELISSINLELTYSYELERSSAVAVGSYSSKYCAVQYKSGYWGFVTALGNQAASGSYVKAAPYNSSGMAVIIRRDGKAALIDTVGKEVALSPDGLKIEDCTALISDKLAVKYNGKYHYCDKEFKELFGEYDYAGSFYGGAAAVMVGSKWGIIDENGGEITGYVFDDIKLDDKGIAFRNDRALAKKDGKYILIDAKGNRVGDGAWEDADAFNADMIAAVMNNGKWGFIDASGTLVVDYTYAAAKSFSNGMAAVQVGEKWGYIRTEDYQIVIEPTFAEANDFSSRGTAFVNNGEKWRLLRLYSKT